MSHHEARILGHLSVDPEQNVELARSVAARGHILGSGRVLLDGAAATLRRPPKSAAFS